MGSRNQNSSHQPISSLLKGGLGLCKNLFTNADLWQGSNGPIFVPQAFEKWSRTFAKTYALGVLEAKLAQPEVTALGSGSSLSIRELFEQVVNMIPVKEDGLIILQTVLDLKTLWK